MNKILMLRYKALARTVYRLDFSAFSEMRINDFLKIDTDGAALIKLKEAKIVFETQSLILKEESFIQNLQVIDFLNLVKIREDWERFPIMPSLLLTTLSSFRGQAISVRNKKKVFLQEHFKVWVERYIYRYIYDLTPFSSQIFTSKDHLKIKREYIFSLPIYSRLYNKIDKFIKTEINIENLSVNKVKTQGKMALFFNKLFDFFNEFKIGLGENTGQLYITQLYGSFGIRSKFILQKMAEFQVNSFPTIYGLNFITLYKEPEFFINSKSNFYSLQDILLEQNYLDLLPIIQAFSTIEFYSADWLKTISNMTSSAIKRIGLNFNNLFINLEILNYGKIILITKRAKSFINKTEIELLNKNQLQIQRNIDSYIFIATREFLEIKDLIHVIQVRQIKIKFELLEEIISQLSHEQLVFSKKIEVPLIEKVSVYKEIQKINKLSCFLNFSRIIIPFSLGDKFYKGQSSFSILKIMKINLLSFKYFAFNGWIDFFNKILIYSVESVPAKIYNIIDLYNENKIIDALAKRFKIISLIDFYKNIKIGIYDDFFEIFGVVLIHNKQKFILRVPNMSFNGQINYFSLSNIKILDIDNSFFSVPQSFLSAFSLVEIDRILDKIKGAADFHIEHLINISLKLLDLNFYTALDYQPSVISDQLYNPVQFSRYLFIRQSHKDSILYDGFQITQIDDMLYIDCEV